jgi:hypothetical protein
MQLDPHLLESAVGWFASGVGSWCLTTIWRLYRKNRYLSEAVRRERASSWQKLTEMRREQNETLNRTLESFLREPTPTLSELVARTEQEWEVRASKKQSDSIRDKKTTKPNRSP